MRVDEVELRLDQRLVQPHVQIGRPLERARVTDRVLNRSTDRRGQVESPATAALTRVGW